ncbi:hypothetical protein [Halorussus halobius]|uniref:hypothetical protein n=1 Tax=Halorussus halobius TaxID=1710537 RepID=UPI001092AB02|nr:hypothetical protein [Halorussus halobius]
MASHDRDTDGESTGADESERHVYANGGRERSGRGRQEPPRRGDSGRRAGGRGSEVQPTGRRYGSRPSDGSGGPGRPGDAPGARREGRPDGSELRRPSSGSRESSSDDRPPVGEPRDSSGPAERQPRRTRPPREPSDLSATAGGERGSDVPKSQRGESSDRDDPSGSESDEASGPQKYGGPLGRTRARGASERERAQRDHERRFDRRLDRQRDFQRDKSGDRYRRK